MTADDFIEARKRLQLTRADLCAILRVDPKTIRRWELGERAIPGPAITVIEALADGWRPRRKS